MSATANSNFPENEMHTTAFWLTLERPLVESLPFSVSDRQSGMFGLLHALESIATLLLMCDARDLGTAIGERPPSPGSETRVGRSRQPPKRRILAEKRILRAQSLSLRRLSRRHRIFRAALSRARIIARTHARTDRRMPLRQRMPVLRRPCGEKGERAKEAALAILNRLCD